MQHSALSFGHLFKDTSYFTGQLFKLGRKSIFHVVMETTALGTQAMGVETGFHSPGSHFLATFLEHQASAETNALNDTSRVVIASPTETLRVWCGSCPVHAQFCALLFCFDQAALGHFWSNRRGGGRQRFTKNLSQCPSPTHFFPFPKCKIHKKYKKVYTLNFVRDRKDLKQR